jgi:flagellar assembly protein FliH
MSSSSGYNVTPSIPVTTLQYRDMADMLRDVAPQMEHGAGYAAEPGSSQAEERIPEFELAAKIKQERADSARETEESLRHEFEQKLLAARAPIAAAVSGFIEERNDYYARVESEVVQLALAIAAKILHREAQVDPMLVATLVRIAIEKLREGSGVTVRVSPGRISSWKTFFAAQPGTARVDVIEDAQLSDQDCLLETELGTANFGLDTQLKEVEQGFFDLLALRPAHR